MKKFFRWFFWTAFVAGLTFLLVSNDFAMCKTLSKDEVAKQEAISFSYADFLNDKSYDFTVESTQIEGETTNKATLTYKEIDGKFEAELTEGDTTTNYYYIDGKLYTKIGEEKSFKTQTLQNAKNEVIFEDVTGIVSLLLYSNVESKEITLKSAVKFDFKPFYVIGTVYSLKDDATPKNTYKYYVDAVGNFRGINLEVENGSAKMDVFNAKKVKLNLPTSAQLAEYVKA